MIIQRVSRPTAAVGAIEVRFCHGLFAQANIYCCELVKLGRNDRSGMRSLSDDAHRRALGVRQLCADQVAFALQQTRPPAMRQRRSGELILQS